MSNLGVVTKKLWNIKAGLGVNKLHANSCSVHHFNITHSHGFSTYMKLLKLLEKFK